jgi:hypothetical protein
LEKNLKEILPKEDQLVKEILTAKAIQLAPLENLETIKKVVLVLAAGSKNHLIPDLKAEEMILSAIAKDRHQEIEKDQQAADLEKDLRVQELEKEVAKELLVKEEKVHHHLASAENAQLLVDLNAESVQLSADLRKEENVPLLATDQKEENVQITATAKVLHLVKALEPQWFQATTEAALLVKEEKAHLLAIENLSAKENQAALAVAQEDRHLQETELQALKSVGSNYAKQTIS